MRYFKMLLLLCSLFSVVAADQTSDMYFHLSIQKYLEGDSAGAIANSEQAINIGGSSNKKLIAFYVKVLLEKGGNLVRNKQYQDALPYFEKAFKVDPGNKEIQSVIKLINSKLNPVDNTISRKSAVITKTDSTVPDQNFIDLIKILQSNQDRLIENLVRPGKSLEVLIEKSDAERRELIKLLANKDNQMVDVVKSQNKSLIIVMYLLVAAIFIAIGAYFSTAKGSRRKETAIINQQEAILNFMVQQQHALKQGSNILRLSEGNIPTNDFVTPRQMLNDPKPRIRAKGLEIIEAQLVQENEEPEVVLRILKPFLEDTDNRVKANAVKILFRYKPDEALKCALEMIMSADKWMKVSGAWILGEMEGFEKAALLLMEKINEGDHYFKKRVVKGLAKLTNKEARIQLSLEMQEKVKMFIEKAAIRGSD